MRSALTKAVGFAVSAALMAAVCTTSGDASAGTAQVDGTGKGIVGGALLGGEIGFVGLAAFGAKPGWLYYTVPTAFAIGGGIGGYFIEQSADPQIPMYMLAGGMALLIPTVVITLSATAYRPTSEDSTPADAAPGSAAPVGGAVKVDASTPSTTGGSPSTPVPGGSGTTTTTPLPPATKHKPAKPTSLRTPRGPGFALVNLDDSKLQLAIPAVQIRPAYSLVEVEKYGLSQRYELHTPVLAVAF